MSYNLWGRLRYMLSPQFDIYEQVAGVVAGNILDVGCGTGFGTHLLSRTGGIVRGVDVDRTAVKFAKRAFDNHHVRFQFFDIAKSFKLRGKYDYITMIDVIEHIKDDKTAVENVRNLLKTGGCFICSTPNKMSRYRKSDYHIREYTPTTFRYLLDAIFEDVNLRDYKLDPLNSAYENPMIAICRKEGE